MPIIYRNKKGAPLSSDEADGNFEELEQRIEALKVLLAQGKTESLAEIKLNGTRLEFFGTSGIQFESVNLPVVTWQPKGEWKIDVLYNAYDVVSRENYLYVCITAHKSIEEFQTPNWQKLLEIPKNEITLAILPFYAKETLPKDPKLGSVGLFDDGDHPKPVFFEGKQWRFMDGRPIK